MEANDPSHNFVVPNQDLSCSLILTTYLKEKYTKNQCNWFTFKYMCLQGCTPCKWKQNCRGLQGMGRNPTLDHDSASTTSFILRLRPAQFEQWIRLGILAGLAAGFGSGQVPQSSVDFLSLPPTRLSWHSLCPHLCLSFSVSLLLPKFNVVPNNSNPEQNRF